MSFWKDAWTPLVLSNGWSHYTQTPGYPAPAYRLEGDRVYLRGLLQVPYVAPPGPTFPQTIGTLPEGLRPKETETVEFFADGVKPLGAAISKDGEIVIQSSGVPIEHSVSLNNVSFSIN